MTRTDATTGLVAVRDRPSPRYGSLVAACVLGLGIAAVAAYVGFVAGGPFMGTDPEPAAAWAGWGVAGVALAAPVAGLRALGFRVRPAVVVTVAVAIAVAVTVLGYFVTIRGGLV